MRKQLYVATALAALLAAPASAQTTPPADQPVAPAPAPQTAGQPTAPSMGAGTTATVPATPDAGQTMTPSTGAGTTTTTAPATGMQPAPSATTTAGAVSGSGLQFVDMQHENEVLANDIIGTEVQNNNGETLGSISDMILAQDGSLKAVIIGVGGFLGIGDRDVAVPWSSINVSHDQGQNLVLKLDAGREQLENAPEFKTAADRQAEEAARIQQQSAPAVGSTTGGLMTPAPNNPASPAGAPAQ